jgi:thiol-disulfide isomerase/thioredoxin
MVTPTISAETPNFWVFCLCAQWCGACREYQPLFEHLAAEMPQARFVWVDVEKHDALLGELDIENFPTLLLTDLQMQPCFAGVVLPHADTLKRMCQAALSGDFPALSDPQWQALVPGLSALGKS